MRTQRRLDGRTQRKLDGRLTYGKRPENAEIKVQTRFTERALIIEGYSLRDQTYDSWKVSKRKGVDLSMTIFLSEEDLALMAKDATQAALDQVSTERDKYKEYWKEESEKVEEKDRQIEVLRKLIAESVAE